MSQPIDPGAPGAPPRDDDYEVLLAAVRARFELVTGEKQGKTHLFSTDAPALYDAYLEGLAPAHRRLSTCSTCRKFVSTYGGVVAVTPEGKTVPVLWDAASAPGRYQGAIRALAEAVSRAPITGVFLSTAATWGVPVTGAWTHLAITPREGLVYKPTVLRSASQIVAEKTQDHETLLRALDEYPLDVVRNALSLLKSGALTQPEKTLGVAQWLLDLHEARKGARNTRAKESLTWLAVAGAPAGFCHVRSTMIGTLLDDLKAGLPFPEIKSRLAARLDPLQYQRPQAAPTAGNIAQAEKIIARLKAEGALERRFARLADIQTLWRPGSAKAEAKKAKGVFSHLLSEPRHAPGQIEAPAVTMTWDKFSRTVLPTAETIEYLVPESDQAYVAMVTAKNPDAPPIVQWDFPDERNPVTWYVYHKGSAPARWNLKAGVHHPVTAVALSPSMWSAKRTFENQNKAVAFLLQGARDTQYSGGAGFFPTFLKSEFHEIRATMEAYAKNAKIEGKDDAEACGIVLSKGGTWNLTFRVTARDGSRTAYKLDRWD
jgi:hypothetical protein